jgi:nitroreductase
MADQSVALEARYGADAAELEELLAAWNPVLSGLLEHRSVRAYLDRPLPPRTLETLIAAAQSAASSSNLQAWSVVAIESAERRARLADLAGSQRHIREAPLFLVWLADLARLDHLATAGGVVAQGLDYLESLLLGVIDAALAAQNAVVALESLGLASVYIGAIRNQPLPVAAELGLPPRVFPVFGLCVGHPDPGRPAAVKPRLPQAAVLHREQYSLDVQQAAIARYDRVMAAFYASQGMPVEQWTGHSVRRVATPEALNGRQHLVEQLRKMGFGLR